MLFASILLPQDSQNIRSLKFLLALQQVKIAPPMKSFVVKLLSIIEESHSSITGISLINSPDYPTWTSRIFDRNNVFLNLLQAGFDNPSPLVCLQFAVALIGEFEVADLRTAFFCASSNSVSILSMFLSR